MSEPQTPPPPPSAQAAPKKGLSPVAWILIGCLGLLLIAGLGIGACSIFVAKKATEIAGDFAENPARAAAEMVVRLNPELELVSSDDEAETLTIRNKETGEEMTVDWSEIEKGNFSFSSDGGTFEINASGDGDGGLVTMTDAEGSKTQYFGPGSEAEIPDWIPLTAGAENTQSTFSTRSDDEVSGAFTFTTSESVAEVLEFYAEELTSAGFEITRNSYSGGGRDGGGVNGNHASDTRTLNVGAADSEDGTQVTVSYSQGG